MAVIVVSDVKKQMRKAFGASFRPSVEIEERALKAELNVRLFTDQRLNFRYCLLLVVIEAIAQFTYANMFQLLVYKICIH